MEPARILDHLEQVIVGKRGVLELVLAALLARGHVLLEDVPGLGKTVLARALARGFTLGFSRVQMTPDLLPADLTGTGVWNPDSRQFTFQPGPIFAPVLLADELNRATPRTQSGLLEAMEERTVTVDGVRHTLPAPFFVIATQNPIEQHGVFPLPEAQLDRFLIQVSMGYPSHPDEMAIVRAQARAHPLESLQPIASQQDYEQMRQALAQVHTSDAVLEYIVLLVRSTRVRDDVMLGASPRASLALQSMARALAYVRGSRFVLPDHVKLAAPAVLRHRLVLTSQARLAGTRPDAIVQSILEDIPAPIHEGAGA